MNEWLKDYAEKSGAVYLNYYSALLEGRAFKKDLTADGIVPNAAGYEIMAALAEKAITQALSH
jgi:lysophospholipase L1-like esterase